MVADILTKGSAEGGRLKGAEGSGEEGGGSRAEEDAGENGAHGG